MKAAVFRWRDGALTALAVGTVLACTLGIGPFDTGGPHIAAMRSAALLP